MFGLFTALYGTAWYVGNAAMGLLYDRSITATIGFCVACQLAAIPFFIVVGRKRSERAKDSDQLRESL